MAVILKTKRTHIDVPNSNDIEALLSFINDNKTHLAPWEPTRDKHYFTKENVQNLIKDYQIQFHNQTSYYLAAFDLERQEILAMCNFTNVIRGPFQACYLGYCVAEKYQGQGIMFEVVEAGLDYVFNELKLHRVMANYIPHNIKSAQLLTRLGFEKEGLAKRYLKINGTWQDHVLTAKINPHFIDD